MLHVLTYDPLWLIAALVLLVPAVYLLICRESLELFFRKALLEKVSEEEQPAVEESLSRRDQYVSDLRVVAAVLELAFVICLVVGRVLTLEESRWLMLEDRLAELIASGASESALTSILESTAPTALALAGNVAILGLEIFLLGGFALYLLPSIVARAWAEPWLLRNLPVIERVGRVIDPLRIRFEKLADFGGLVLGGRRDRTPAAIAEEEIRSAVEEGQREGILETRDLRMIESVMNYGALEVSEVMTPRTEMVALNIEDPLDVNLEKIVECGHSRIPVYRGDKDHVIGVLYVKELQRFFLRGETIDLEKIVRPPYYVRETDKIGELFQEFRTHRQHLAIVLDEHGGTAGLVTIEDIIEEIVGDIGDELDQEPDAVQEIAPGTMEVDASVHIDDLNEQLSLQIPEGETYDTVGGYLFESMGRVPEVGDTYSENGVRFEVIEADERRVHRLRLYLDRTPAAASRRDQPAAASEMSER